MVNGIMVYVRIVSVSGFEFHDQLAEPLEEIGLLAWAFLTHAYDPTARRLDSAIVTQ